MSALNGTYEGTIHAVENPHPVSFSLKIYRANEATGQALGIVSTPDNEFGPFELVFGPAGDVSHPTGNVLIGGAATGHNIGMGMMPAYYTCMAISGHCSLQVGSEMVLKTLYSHGTHTDVYIASLKKMS